MERSAQPEGTTLTQEQAFNPTIGCPCDRSMFERQFTYTQPPTGETAFDWSGQKYERGYDRCELCGHWFASHALNLNNLYTGAYVEATYGDQMDRNFDRIIGLPEESSDNAGRCRRILAFAEGLLGTTSKPSLLDVGSGLGVFPYVMKKSGWDCSALDPDPHACKHISDRIGVRVINADFLTMNVEDLGDYDVVTLNKVVEHVVDPCQMLRRAAEITRTGGFVYVEVPDADGAASVGPGREEFFVEHHHVFSAASLSSTIERSGLRIGRLDRLEDPSGKFTLACFAFPIAERLTGSNGN